MLTKTNVETNLERYCNQTQLDTRQWQSCGRNLKKWTNLKLIAKSKVDASFREARKAGEGTNTAGHVDEDMLIISADRCISDSAERVTEIFQNTPAFSGISGALDLFQAPVGNSEIPIQYILANPNSPVPLRKVFVRISEIALFLLRIKQQ